MEMEIIRNNDPKQVVRQLAQHLSKSENDQRQIVLAMCGIAGAGKTTLAKEVITARPGFQRLSIDEIIASRHGICGIDYEPSKHDAYSGEADGIFLRTFKELLLEERTNMVLDRSFYAKEDRDVFKAMVEAAGARWLLLSIRLDENSLRQRIVERRKKGIDADSALDISEELFGKYVEGFEYPQGEGEIVVEYTE